MDFWQVHGIWFLIFIARFPRITMFVVGTVSSFGLLGWPGLHFRPPSDGGHSGHDVLLAHQPWSLYHRLAGRPRRNQ